MASWHPIRFHVATGPGALFERVRFKFRDPRDLQLHAPHLQNRAAARQAPLEALRRFDPASWEVVTVEVRSDTGKFVTSAWRTQVDGQVWWVVIGFNDTIQTVYATDKLGLGDGVTTAGAFYALVEQVNRALMDDERLA